MKNRSLRRLALLCGAVVCLGVSTALARANPLGAEEAQVGPVRVSLIALNDLHGALLPSLASVLMPDPAFPQGLRVAAGGAAYVATLVNRLRARNPQASLLVAAGDLVGASPLASGLFHDEPSIEFLNHIGLALSSVGNHEFDRGRDELMRLQGGGCSPPNPVSQTGGARGVPGQDTCMQDGRFAGAGFQYLAANVWDRARQQPLLPPTALRVVGGVTLGFIGLTLRSTGAMVLPSAVAGLQFLDEVETVNHWAPVLRAQGASAVVVLIHQGGRTLAPWVQDPDCPGLSGPIVELVDRMDATVDVVISGHTHQEYVCTRPDGKLLTQAGSQGQLLTAIDLLIDPQAHRVVAKQAHNWVVANGGVLHTAQGQALPQPSSVQALAPDPAVQALVQRYADRSAPLAGQVVGRLIQALERRPNAAGESSLGAVVADAYLAGSSDPGAGVPPAQVAFSNPGGLRADLRSTVVTQGQLAEVLPFGNTLVSMDLSGQQLLRLLEQQWEWPQPPGGRVLAVSEGFGYTWDARQPEGAMPGKGQRVVPGSMRLQGRPIAPQQRVRITVNSYMVGTADRHSVLNQGRNPQQGESDWAALSLYVRLRGVLGPPAPGRIQRLP